MDVMFFEHQPYYPKSDIQGENNFTQEHQLWDEISDLDISHTSSNPVNTQIETGPTHQNEPMVPYLDPPIEIPELTNTFSSPTDDQPNKIPSFSSLRS